MPLKSTASIQGERHEAYDAGVFDPGRRVRSQIEQMATVTTVTICLPVLLSRSAVAPTSAASTNHRSWAADNGNGTYSNPLFYDEFSDPDMIRVGSDYYLTGTTMHAMPGLPILHSRDLVNWRWIAAMPLTGWISGPASVWRRGKEIYGQGIWAPSFRYHEGTYYIFANVNRFGLQVFRASDPRGPWKHNRIDRTLHDLSVLFDDNGKIYAVYGARTIHVVELNAQLTDIVSRDGSRSDRTGTRHGRGVASLQAPRPLLHRERHPWSPRTNEMRASRTSRGALGSEDDQRRRKPGNRPELPLPYAAAVRRTVRDSGAESRGVCQPHPAPGRHHRYA